MHTSHCHYIYEMIPIYSFFATIVQILFFSKHNCLYLMQAQQNCFAQLLFLICFKYVSQKYVVWLTFLHDVAYLSLRHKSVNAYFAQSQIAIFHSSFFFSSILQNWTIKRIVLQPFMQATYLFNSESQQYFIGQ